MKTTKQMIDEHTGIIRMLGILSVATDRFESNEEINLGHFNQMIDFFQVFADKCHHGKEEDLFFPFLVSKGMSQNKGPIAVLLAEHKKGREYVKSLKDAVEKYTQKAIETKKSIIENSRNYKELLTDHIEKENKVLFPMADEMMTINEDDELFEKFERVEIEKIGVGIHDKYHKLLDDLGKIY